ncbi:hypothetical protein UFOVP389_32 [uncultured Caudovirales phage]|uniref:Uncharacterized protein n=1 Tax=uncultured Caudovirales phage TaxID=2100421 RepID=A0A6J7X1H8_9CAUD|nr:hypothetical protein UFOVP389_32 [uncultured Caudovirales phage]
MSKVLDKATAHFRNQISGAMQIIDVPEWETKIYYKSAVSLKEEGKILELSQQGKTVEALVESLIVRARNEDGTKMFNFADKAALLNEVDPKVLIKVVGEMNKLVEEELGGDAVAKN